MAEDSKLKPTRRAIDASIAHDESLNAVSEFAQLVYLRGLPHTDARGMLRASPEYLRGKVMPITVRKVDEFAIAVVELLRVGLLTVHADAMGTPFVQYNPASFERINRIFIKSSPKPAEVALRPMTADEYEALAVSKRSKPKTLKVSTAKPKAAPTVVAIDDADQSMAARLMRMLYTSYPRVMAMQQPLTMEQAATLCEEFAPRDIKDVFDQMENYNRLTRYLSTYLTARTWLRRRETNGATNGTGKRNSVDVDALARRQRDYDALKQGSL